jgi:hypothetical protein
VGPSVGAHSGRTDRHALGWSKDTWAVSNAAATPSARPKATPATTSASRWEAGGSVAPSSLTLWTTCDSPPRLPTRSRIRREASTGRLNGAGCTGIRASRVAPVGPWSFAWSLIEQISHHLRAPQGRSHVSDDPRTPRLPPSSGVLGDTQNRALGGRDPKTVAEPLPRRSGLSRGE